MNFARSWQAVGYEIVVLVNLRDTISSGEINSRYPNSHFYSNLYIRFHLNNDFIFNVISILTTDVNKDTVFILH